MLTIFYLHLDWLPEMTSALNLSASMCLNLLIMNYSDVIGFIGVFITLLAYFLIIFNFISKDGRLFYLMNIVGAGLACYASILIVYWPFVVLEGTWTLISIAGLVKLMRTQPQ